MNRVTHFCGLLLLGFAFLGFVGCDSSTKKGSDTKVAKDDHDHEHGHKKGKHADEHAPANFAEAVKKIEEYRVIIKEASAKNDLKAADEQLHEVGELLVEHLLPLVEKAQIKGAKLDDVKKAREQLIESFGKIDDKVHDPAKGATYEQESAKIEAAMDTLQLNVPGET